MELYQWKLLDLVNVNPPGQQLPELLYLFTSAITLVFCFLDISKCMIISKTLEWALEDSKNLKKNSSKKTHVIEVLVSGTTIPTQSSDRMCKFEVWLIIYQFLQWLWVWSPLTFLCHPCQLSWHTGKVGHINYLTLFPRVNSKMETGEGGWQELKMTTSHGWGVESRTLHRKQPSKTTAHYHTNDVPVPLVLTVNREILCFSNNSSSKYFFNNNFFCK